MIEEGSSEDALAWQKQENSPKDAWQRARGQRRLANGSSEQSYSRRQLGGARKGEPQAEPNEAFRKSASRSSARPKRRGAACQASRVNRLNNLLIF